MALAFVLTETAVDLEVIGIKIKIVWLTPTVWSKPKQY